MNGEAHWLTLLLLAGIAIGVLALFYFAARLSHRFRLARRQFECPVRKEHVEAGLIRDEKTGEFTSVQSCSHFADPAAVTCEKRCVPYLNATSKSEHQRSAPLPQAPPSAVKGVN
jgi:hypothetical protein